MDQNDKRKQTCKSIKIHWENVYKFAHTVRNQKIEPRRTYRNHALSKTNEKRGQKMTFLLRHVCENIKMLKFHYVLK